MAYSVAVFSRTEGHDDIRSPEYVDSVFGTRDAALQCAFDLAVEQARSAGDGGCYIRSNSVLLDKDGKAYGFALTEAIEYDMPGMSWTFKVVEVDYDFVV